MSYKPPLEHPSIGRQLEEMADELLRQQANEEHCPECDKIDQTKNRLPIPQDYHNSKGQQLVLVFEKYTCNQCGHKWDAGEGRRRSFLGDDQILMPEHLKARRRAEIYTSTGTPDPSIELGNFFRAHPEGRKINKRRSGGYYQ